MPAAKATAAKMETKSTTFIFAVEAMGRKPMNTEDNCNKYLKYWICLAIKEFS